MNCEIKSRWSLEGSKVLFKALFSGVFASMKLCVEAAVEAKVLLTHADLRGADLKGAILTGADLGGADLRGAILTGADFTGADLIDADLSHADLTGANLSGADLTGVVLIDADLTHVDLSPFKNDLWEILAHAPREAAGLRQALVDGKIEGSCDEEEGEYLVGTLAKLRGSTYKSLEYSELDVDLDLSRPAEQWFSMIKPGQKPDKNKAAKLAVEWIDGWAELWKAAGKK